MAYPKRQPFHYNQADKDSSRDLQSLRHHLIWLFDIQKIIYEIGQAKYVPTSEDLEEMLVDFNMIKKELKTLFIISGSAKDIQPYNTLGKVILKRVDKSINKIATSKTLIATYERLKDSIDEEDYRIANGHYEQCIEKFNASHDFLQDIVINPPYNRMLHLIGLTWL